MKLRDAWLVFAIVSGQGCSSGPTPQPVDLHTIDPNQSFTFVAFGGSGPSDVWLVGAGAGTTCTTSEMGVGVAVHWDGSMFTPTTVSSGVVRISSVWSSGPTDAWAIAELCGGHSAVIHWDSTAWSVADPQDFLFAIAGSGPNDVWATADRSLLHWDGSAWTSIPAPQGANPLEEIVVDAPGSVFVGTPDGIDHVVGGTWTQVGPSTWAASTLNRHLVSCGGSVFASGNNEIHPWNGTAFASAIPNHPAGSVDQLACTSSNRVWVTSTSGGSCVGSGMYTGCTDLRYAIDEWTGTAWNRTVVSHAYEDMWAIGSPATLWLIPNGATAQLEQLTDVP